MLHQWHDYFRVSPVTLRSWRHRPCAPLTDLDPRSRWACRQCCRWWPVTSSGPQCWPPDWQAANGHVLLAHAARNNESQTARSSSMLLAKRSSHGQLSSTPAGPALPESTPCGLLGTPIRSRFSVGVYLGAELPHRAVRVWQPAQQRWQQPHRVLHTRPPMG